MLWYTFAMQNASEPEELYPEYRVQHRRRALFEVVGILVLVCIVVFLFLQVSKNDVQVAIQTEGPGNEVRELFDEKAREETIARLLGKELPSEDKTSDELFAASMQHDQDLEISGGPRPATSARAYMVQDVLSGQLLMEHNATTKRPIASITKLITALVAEREIGLDTQLFFVPEEQYYSVADLFRPLFLRSNNTVAENIALFFGEERFVEYMDTYVAELGMYNTSFGDASGLSPENISTAKDLTMLAEHLVTEKKYLLDISKEQEVTIASMAGKEWRIENHNRLSSDPYFLGGKLGYTDEALQTSLSVFIIPIEGDMHTVSVAVLGSYDWKQDTRMLLRWLLEHATVVDPVDSESSSE
jgi:D-alanyl-D-alanine carboxypeptidase